MHLETLPSKGVHVDNLSRVILSKLIRSGRRYWKHSHAAGLFQCIQKCSPSGVALKL
jgi:hypothetical protein